MGKLTFVWKNLVETTLTKRSNLTSLTVGEAGIMFLLKEDEIQSTAYRIFLSRLFHLNLTKRLDITFSSREIERTE